MVPGGFGDRGVEGKIEACRYARLNKIPFLGKKMITSFVIGNFRNLFGLPMRRN